MKYSVICLHVLTLFVILSMVYSKCPSKSKIYEKGISREGRKIVVDEHNKYRKLVLQGKLPGQPKGANISMLSYDRRLGSLGRLVSQTCKLKHVKINDRRYRFVGQNIHINWNSRNTSGQDWETAIESWFKEHKLYKYPNDPSKKTGHYTQLIWGNSTSIGCDFINFYDTTKPKTPFAKLYTCNYGPGGNIKGNPPYPKA